MKNILITTLLFVFASQLNAQAVKAIIINSKADISKLSLGDHYLVAADVIDPMEYDTKFRELQGLIDKHIADLEGSESNRPEIHRCYFELSVSQIITGKYVRDHNVALNVLNLASGGNERAKVTRITDHLEKLGYRKDL